MLDHAFEKLERIVAFRFSFNGYEIEIGNTIFVSWIVMTILIVLAMLFTRKLSVLNPSKSQIVIETLVQTVNGLCRDAIGHHWRDFVPFIGTLLLFLVMSNIITVFNFIPGLHLYPPTKDINVAGSLAAVSGILVFLASFKYLGVKGWAGLMVSPMPAMLPFKLLEYFTKPLSLCLRLFGNVMAAFLIMELVMEFAPLLGAPLSAFFDLFDGILQAYIFVYLTTLYLGEAVEEPH